MKNFSILYIDDEESNLKGFKAIYFTEYTIFTATSGKEALKILEDNDVHIIITDQKMPEMTGVEFLSKAIRKFPDPIRIILTGYSDIEVLMKAINECGIFRYLTKPWNETEMNMVIQQALDIYSLRKENTLLVKKLTEINATLEERVVERTQKIEEQNEAIRKQNLELAEANREKNNLIAIVAHDLKSPLNQINTLANIVKVESRNLTDEQREYIDLITKCTERLRNLINRILNLNAIENREIIVRLEKADVQQIINDIVNQTRVLANEKNLNVQTSCSNGRYFAAADINYLTQVIENILDNAIKFSPRDKNIFIEAEKKESIVKIKIRDEGPGLSEEDIKKAFNRYQTLTAKPTGGEESSGLGLFIAKRYVDAMQGRIWCESKPGEGASFVLEFEVA